MNIDQVKLTKIDTFEVSGYCIICCNDICLDINQPLCNNCLFNLGTAKLGDWLDGYYCHSCGNPKESICKHYPLCEDCKEFDRDKNVADSLYDKILQKYQSMSTLERQIIKPKWACRESQFLSQYRPFGRLTELKLCDLLDILRLDTTNIFNNEVKDNRRTLNVLRRWEKGLYVDPPSIIYNDSVNFLDGRHRALAAHFLGADTVPVYCIFEKKVKSQ